MMFRKPSLLYLFIFLCTGFFTSAHVYSESAEKIKIVKVNPRSFNPAQKEAIDIQFSCPYDGQAIVRLYDRKAYQVREFALESITAGDVNTVHWDGRDETGRVVPDEAYFFTIEAVDQSGHILKYDPTEKLKTEFKPFLAAYDKATQKLHFTLEQDAVVDIRSGIADGGPLMIKLLEWKPMLQGQHSIAWDGWDASRNLQVAEHPKHHLFSQIVPLPENSILAVGNHALGQQLYSEIYDIETLKRKDDTDYSDQLFSQFDVSPYKDISPAFDFEFNNVQSKRNNPGHKDPEQNKLEQKGLAVAGDKLSLTIRLEESVRQRVTETRYEILTFIDQMFVTEIEEGRSPARLVIDTSGLGVGEHLLTVNVVTLQGGVATVSHRFIKEH